MNLNCQKNIQNFKMCQIFNISSTSQIILNFSQIIQKPHASITSKFSKTFQIFQNLSDFQNILKFWIFFVENSESFSIKVENTQKYGNKNFQENEFIHANAVN